MRNVAIIGGGLSGLSCAFALKHRGIPAVVFEAAAGPGGRAQSAVYLFGSDVYTNTFRLCDQLGMSRDLVEIIPVAGQLYKGRVYHHRVSSVTGLLSFKGLNLADKALLSRMAYLLVKHGSKLDFHHPEFGAELDDESVASFVKRELSQNILNFIAGPLISTLFFYGSEETSKLLYLNLAKHMFNTRMYTIQGGLHRLTQRLAEEATIEKQRQVDGVGVDAGEFVINGRSFSDVVIAVPGNAVLGISGLAEMLDEGDRRFFENCRYGRALTVTFDTARPVDQCYALSIPRVESQRAATIIFHDFIDPDSAVGGGGRITIVGGGDSITPQELLEDFGRIYPVVPGSPIVSDWTAAMPKFPPGRFRELAAFLARQRKQGLFFCGDYLMGPFVEAAVTTGFRSAAAISEF